jgi:multidrug resistance efflux pump
MDGLVRGIHVALFDDVEAGATVAVMDDAIIHSELLTSEAELTQLRAQLSAEQQRLTYSAVEYGSDLRRHEIDVEAARLTSLDRRVQQESDKVKLSRLEIVMARQREEAAQGILNKLTADETRLRYEALKKEIEGNAPVLVEADAQLALAISRRDEYSANLSTLSRSEFLAPIRAGITVQEKRIATIMQKKAQLTIAAPISGQVAQIFHRPGETVVLGTPLLTITDPNSNLVLAYVDEKFAMTLAKDDPIEVSSKNNPNSVVAGKVKKVGPRNEEYPEHLSGGLMRKWGRPVLVDLVGDYPAGIFGVNELVLLRP